MNKWWYDPSECKEVKVEKTRNELSLSNVAGIFFILASLPLIAAFAGIISC